MTELESARKAATKKGTRSKKSRPKCSAVNCERDAIGGFEELIDASSHDDPNDTIPGLRVFWCEEHSYLQEKASGVGRFLSEAQIKRLS